MSGWRYRLQPLLDLRQREREAVEGSLARLALAMQNARGQAEKARLDLSELTIEPGTDTAASIQVYGLTVERAYARIDALAAELDRLAAEIAQVRERHAVARMREEMLERDRRKARREWLRERERQEEREADDAAARRMTATEWHEIGIDKDETGASKTAPASADPAC